MKVPDRLFNPFVPTVPTCAVRETQSLGQHMLELSCENATVGTNGLFNNISAIFRSVISVALKRLYHWSIFWNYVR